MDKIVGMSKLAVDKSSKPLIGMDIRTIKIRDIEENSGQIEGLPRNPRIISKEKMERLKASISAHPEFLNHNMLHVVDAAAGGKYVVVGGNMRYRALKDLGYEEVPATVFPYGTSAEDLRAYAIVDNSQFGEWDWDALASEWNWQELSGAGLDFPKDTAMFEEERKAKETELLSEAKFESAYYEPKEVVGLRLEDCIDDEIAEKKRRVVEESSLTPEQKDVMKKFCDRFRRIDFEGVANYYAFQATDEEKRVMQRLRLVLADDGSVAGFVEDGMLRVQESVFDGGEDEEEDSEN